MRLKEEEGRTWRQIAEALDLRKETARSRYRRWLKRREPEQSSSAEFCGVQAEQVVRLLRKQPMSRLELSQVLDRSEATVEQIIREMTAAGYGIERENRRIFIANVPTVHFEPEALFPVGETVEISFGVVSDTHGGSKAEQVTALRDFVHVAREEYGVQHILHGGDVFAGWGVYRGQQSDLYVTTGRGQADTVAHNLPQYPDLTWYVLGGNHDYSFYKIAGLDARRELALMGREDIVLLPYDAADLPLLPGIEARLWHPAGGIPYALSYRGQKGAEQLAQAELMQVVMGEKVKPTIRLVVIGHLHVTYMFDHGPMIVLGAGCFEGQNSLLKRKGLVPTIAGWILKCRFVDGMLHRIEPVRIRYREIENDWRPWWSKRQAKREEIEVLSPIFSLEDEGWRA